MSGPALPPAALWLAVMIGGYGLGAIGALATPGRGRARRLAAAGSLAGSAAGLALALDGLFGERFLTLRAPALLEAGGGLALALDPLGALFLAVVAFLGLTAALYSVGYCRFYEGRSSVRALGATFNLFLLTMSLVPCAGNVLTFLLLWEGMSLASYFLVITEADRPEAVGAGTWYLTMTHVGFVALLAAFLLLAGASGTGEFAALRQASPALSPGTRNAAYLLALVGFGSKAGVVPLHVWLPRAHPAAPSHASALMSGAMIKLGIYGVLRVALDLLPGGPPWWGGLVLGLGALSALLGVLYALVEHDLKRLLAYHSVENIGIVLIGLGAGMTFASFGLPALAELGIVAALYHAVNHACFKSLLFLGAGAVVHAAHTGNMEDLGGLAKRMPGTAACFLVGAAAISGLPPLNGFASEWLVFQALLGGTEIGRPEVAALMPLAAAGLALTSGLAAACFVKAFGITFLAMPRSAAAAGATEAPRSMRAGMAVLALACIALGLGPALVVPVLHRVQAVLGRALPAPPPPVAVAWPGDVAGAAGRMSPPLVAALLGALAVGALLALRALATGRVRIGETWGCGRFSQTPRMEYTASAFAEPLRRVFAELYRPTQDLSITFHPDSKYFVRSIAYRSEVQPWLERTLYEPVLALLAWAADRVRRLQAGSLHLYLLYLAVALVTLLLVGRWL